MYLMKNKKKQNQIKPLKTIHVFSKNNQVYIKKSNSYFLNKSPDKDIIQINEEWLPINFQWESLLESRTV